MEFNPRVHIIPARPPSREKRVGIYCRVSTNSTEQLRSLVTQVSALTRLSAATPTWLLVDTYIDISSGKAESKRTEFARMMNDCRNHNLEIIITKSISRFGRDTVEVLEALEELKALNVRVIFEQENLDTADTDSALMISVMQSLAQAENESRSNNIKMGIKQRALQGTSKLYQRKCYGYDHDNEGKLAINEEEAKTVKLVFHLYLKGMSVLGIVKELERLGIPSPTGKSKWCKRTIDVMLSNEKYSGDVRILGKTDYDDIAYLSTDNNPPIISKETFRATQIEKNRRSNVVVTEDGIVRRAEKYSSKK